MKFLITLFTKPPLYVWPLLLTLIFAGVKARKTGTIPLKIFFVIPAFFLTWSTYTIFSRYGINFLVQFLWLVSLSLGAFLGIRIAHKLQITIDKQKNLITVPGSWLPLALSMTIFWNKFAIGMLSILSPELIESFFLLVPELVASFATGIFAGRSIGFFQRYKTTPYTTLRI